MKGKSAIYNLKAVMRETGLSAGTLRAWERRYGLLKPQHTPGGHRLYTEQDVKLIQWLVERQNEGLTISHAVTLWQSMEKSEQDRIQQAAAMVTREGTAMLDNLRRRWIDACLAFDEQAAEQALEEAFAIATPEDACIEVLQKGLAEIGRGWYAGPVSVQQEHFASALATRRLNSLLTAAAPATRPGRILAALPAGEMHAFILQLLALMVRRQGFDVVYLGTNVPLERFRETLALIGPRVVLSAAQTLISAASLRSLAEQAGEQGVALVFGGGIFVQIPGLAERIRGHYLGSNLRDAAQRIEQIMANPKSAPEPKPAAAETSALREKFSAAMTQIEAAAAAAIQPDDTEHPLLKVIEAQFSQQIQAALALGDIHYLDSSAGWLAGFSKSRDLPRELSTRYYAAYRQALEQHLGSEAAPILDWFEQIEKGI